MATNNTVIEFLERHRDKRPVSFHMPGHKGRASLYKKYGFEKFINDVVAGDITEIPGADILRYAKGPIKAVMENYEEQYGVKHTELLVNGSSSGVIASILATVPLGGKLILGRNSHVSAFNALRLGAIRPVYVNPEVCIEDNLQEDISAASIEKKLKENPDADAVFITSPNYYGILSDIESIARITHAYGKILIVDQAHGAHLKFFDEMRDSDYAAENLAADIVIESTHKTLFSFTGTGILNVCSSNVNVDNIREFLNMVETTSPSYILLLSLDANEQIMRNHREEIISSWRADLKYFYEKSREISGLKVIRNPKLDRSKINISMAENGMTAGELQTELEDRNIFAEMAHGEYVLLMTGVGNSRRDYDLLLDALKDISKKCGVGIRRSAKTICLPNREPAMTDVPILKEKIPLYQAEGRVVYEPIIPFPPGIPIACPGEILDYEMIAYFRTLVEEGESIIGIDEEGEIFVGAESGELGREE